MDEVNFDKLKRALSYTRSTEADPILIRKHPTLEDRYQIVDGEHRWRVMRDLWVESMHCEIQTLSDKDARIKTIAKNKFRGEPDSLKLAELIMDLKDHYGVTDMLLETELWYTQEEVLWFESLIKFDYSQFEEALPETADDESIKVLDDVILSMNNRQTRLMNELADRLWVDKSLAVSIAMKHLIDWLDAEAITEQQLMAVKEYVEQEDEQEELVEAFSWPEEEVLWYAELMEELDWEVEE